MPKYIAYDTETHLIKPGCTTPKMVCLTHYDGETEGILLREDGLAWLRRQLLDPDVHLIGQNVFYDLGVPCAEDPSFLPLIFDAIDAGRIHDTILRQKVIDNFHGQLKYVWNEEKKKFDGQRFDLASLVWRHFKVNLFAKKDGEKNPDIWRLRYNELDGIPLEKWPQEAIDYAVDDAVFAYRVFMEQEKELAPEGMPHQPRIVGSAWALDLASTWGFRTDRKYTLKLEAELLEELQQWREIAQECGRFVRRGVTGSKNVKKMREEIAKRVKNPLLTPTGLIKTTREQLRDIPCPVCGEGFDAHHDPDKGINGFQPCETEDIKVIGLWATSEVTRVEKKLSTYIKVLKRGFDIAINCRYNAIIETFRTSSAGPNIQNYPRDGGIRNAIVPRKGWEFAFVDYDTLEMRTFAQVCIDLFGHSDIAVAIAAGEDVHISLAADIRGQSYEECYELYKAGDKAMKNERQFAKLANYAFCGGMGPDAFIDYAKSGYDIIISQTQAQELHSAYRNRWSEVPEYFRYISDLRDNTGKIKHQVFVRTGLVRGRVNYTAGCNGNFQHLAAIGAKDALYQATKECYDPRLESPLYGCRPIIFAHDEIGMEVPTYAIGREGASAATARLEEVMNACMKYWCPDVDISSTGAMCTCWRKGAEPVFIDGFLVPSKPEGRTWVPDLEAV